MNFNIIIKAALKKQRISAYRLAKETKINQGQLSRFLKYNDQMSTRNLQKIFDYLSLKYRGDK